MTRGSLFHEQTARQRIAALVDPGSFDELLPPPERITSPYLAQLGIPVSFDDGVVIGRAKIGGRTIYIAAQVGQFVGGAVGEIHGAKLTGLFKAAARDGVPCVVIVESGGVRLHEGSAGEIAIAETMRAIFECRAKKVPTIAVIATDIGAYGGMGILSTCCDFRVMTEHGRLGISGPIVIEKWMGKKAYDSSNRALVWKTSGGKTKYLLGDADMLVHDTAEAVRESIGKLLIRSSAVSLEAVKARQKELERRLKRFGKTDDPDAVWKGMGVRDVARASLASGPEFVALARRGK
jgi:malonate decarboxylase beta subunit